MIRLLNIYTQQLREFQSPSETVPPYVTASHRWLDGEAKYQDLKEQDGEDTRGLRKVRAFCTYLQTLPDCSGFQWLWIDTVCIDKTNSAELSEAIVSMFRWYQQSYFCIAYLHDVSTGRLDQSQDGTHHALHDSEWITRGWTLQELLAPDVVVFLDCDWHVIGHKASNKQDRLPKNLPYGPSLNHYLTKITDIPENVLWDFSASYDLSYQKKRAWLEKRETSRREDHAYCMLGILHVSMLPMYGEGRQRAWQRLEEEARKYQLLRGQDRTGSELSCYRPSRDLHSKSAEALCRPRHVQQWSNSIGEPGNETAAKAKEKARNDLAGGEDLTFRSDDERTRLATRAREAHDSANKAITESKRLQDELLDKTRKLAETSVRLQALEKENDKVLTLLDTEKHKRKEAVLDCESLRQQLDEEHRQGQRFQQEAITGLWKCKELQEELAATHEALRSENYQRRQAEGRLTEASHQLSEVAKTNARLEASLSDGRKVTEDQQEIRDLKEALAKAIKTIESKSQRREDLDDKPQTTENAPVLSKAPIRFKDGIGRKFSYPFSICRTWRGMKDLINQAFIQTDMIGDHVRQGHYDLTGPSGEIILPQTWEALIQPDWEIVMHLWPFPEEKKKDDLLDPFAHLRLPGYV